MRRAAIPLTILLLATLPRCSYLIEMRAAPTAERPEGGDSIFYDRIAAGEPRPARAYFHSPLYGWLVSGVYHVVGRNLTAVRLLQHLFGVLTALLIYLCTLELTGRRLAAALAGGLQALLVSHVFYEGHLLVASTLSLCVALVLFLLTRRRGALAPPLLGLAIGVAALGRPTALILLPLVCLWLWRFGEGARRRGAALVVAGSLAAIFPVTLRNYLVEGDLVPVTSNFGLNLYIGNNPAARGSYNLPEGMWFRPGEPRADFRGAAVARRELGRGATSAQISSWWARRALRFMAQDPLAVVKLTGRKAALLVSSYEHPQLVNLAGYSEVCPTLALLPPAGLLIAPGLLGLGLLLAEGGRRRLFALLALAYGAVFLLFFVEGRYRATWLVLLAPAAGYGLARVLDLFRQWSGRRAAPLLGGLALAAALVFLVPVERIGPAVQYSVFGRALAQQGKAEAALRWYRRAIALRPGDPLILEGLGIAQSAVGRHGDALRSLEEAARLWPESGHVLNNLALVQQRLGRLDLAERTLWRAIEREPALAEAYANLGGVLEEQGQTARAREAYDAALRLAPRGAGWIPLVQNRLARLRDPGHRSPPNSPGPPEQ